MVFMLDIFTTLYSSLIDVFYTGPKVNNTDILNNVKQIYNKKFYSLASLVKNGKKKLKNVSSKKHRLTVVSIYANSLCYKR